VALALYRKYRPRTFAEVIGQEHVTEPLTQALRSGRLHHAYLFSGPRGCGKTSSARILARSLNCEQGPTPEPCGVCASCRSLANDGTGSIDVIEIDAASHGGVDDARDLREKAFFAPAASRYKIYVIDEAHMVSSAGFNALLKLVEEPPDYVKFIFATTEPEKVLGTIKSRTHHYPFRLIPPAVLRPYLQQLAEAEGIPVEPAVFPLVVRAGGGSARDSLSVLDQLIAGAGPDGVTYARAVALLGVTDVTLIDDMCDAVAAGDGAAAYATIDQVAEAGHDPRRFASDLLERFRDLIVLQQVPDAVAKGLIDGPVDQLDAMSAQATRLGPATLSRCADIVHNGLVEMRGTTAPRLLLELIAARMLLPGADDSAGALLQRLERMERRLALSGDPTEPVRGELSPTAAGTADGAGPSVRHAGAPAAGQRFAGDEKPQVRPPAAAPSDSAPALSAAMQPSAKSSSAAGSPARLEHDGSLRSAAPAPQARRPEPDAVLPDAPDDSVAEPAGTGLGELTAASIREVWPEIVTAVGRQSKKLAALASGATVRDLDGQTLVLTFRFPAHARMVGADPDLITNALYEALGGRWDIRCEVAGEAGAVQVAPGGAPPRNAPVQKKAPTARSASAPSVPAAAPARPREAAPQSRADGSSTSGGDDEWPEPARPGGAASAADEGQPPVEPEATAGGAVEYPPGEPASAGPNGGSASGGAPGRVSHALASASDSRRAAAPGGGRARDGGHEAASDNGRGASDGARASGSEGARAAAADNVSGSGGGRSAASPSARAAARAAAGGSNGGGVRQPTTHPTVPPTDPGDAEWLGGADAEEPPYDPDYDGPVRAAAPAYEGFDPGDEPLDDVLDENTARQSSEQQAMQLLQDAFGAEKIGEA
jgi:DNA polymerase III subunit gamma/tau